MPYLYDDEDNYPMNEDALADWERKQEAMEAAREIRQSQAYCGFMDDMEIPRGSACWECPWMKEGILEAFYHEVDDDLCYPEFVFDLAHRMCAVCNQHKNDSEEERWDALDQFFREEDEKNGNT